MRVSDGCRCCTIVKENEKLLVCSIIGALRIHLLYNEGFFFFSRLGRHLLYMVWWFIFCAFTCSEAYMNVFKSPWYFHGVWMQTHSSRLDRRWGNVRTLKSELLQQNIQQVLLTLKWIKRVHRGLVFIPFLTSHWLCLCKISMLNLVFASAYYRCISKN